MPMKASRNAAIIYSCTILYAALIFYLSSRPGTQGIISGWYVIADKLDHVLEYAILGVLLFLSFHVTSLDYRLVPRQFVSTRDKEMFSAFILGTLYGISDEIHQSYVPDRVASGYDVLADTVGILLGIYLIVKYLERGTGSKNPDDTGNHAEKVQEAE